MKNYVKPMVIKSEDVAESVYMASGCWTVSGAIHQTIVLENRTDYRFQLNASHIDEQHRGVTTWTITFDNPVKFKECNAVKDVLVREGDTLVFTRQTADVTNANESIGIGDCIVTFAGAGDPPASIMITNVTVTD